MEVQSVSSVAPTVALPRSASQLIAQKKGGTPPGGGAKLAAASTSSNSISSTAKALYDKRDADQDGTVSIRRTFFMR